MQCGFNSVPIFKKMERKIVENSLLQPIGEMKRSNKENEISKFFMKLVGAAGFEPTTP